MTESLSGRLLRQAATSRKRRRLTGAVLRAAAPLLPVRPSPREPVFILGSPRSGTTLVFEILDRSPRLASLKAESHLLWEMFHGLRQAHWRSHEVGPDAVTGRERRVLNWAIDRVSLGRRYLDKAPRNCFRATYLHALFPDAWFIHLKRDGRASVSSLITGWRAPGMMFPGTRMPAPLSIHGYTGTTWKFIVPPGWEAYATGKTLAEVCAFQWVAANQAILDARERIGDGHWIELSYEAFVDAPQEETMRLLDRIGLPADPEVVAYAGDLDHHVTKAVTPPSPDKWRSENPGEIEQVMPLIEPMMRRLGYEVGGPAER
jgi:hypothetical protein